MSLIVKKANVSIRKKTNQYLQALYVHRGVCTENCLSEHEN